MDSFIDGLIESWVPPPAPPPVSDCPEASGREWRTLIADPDTDSGVRVCDEFLGAAARRTLFKHCAALPNWEFEKPLGFRPGTVQRRGVCMQAVSGVEGYRYSGQTVHAEPLDDTLGPLLDRVNAALGTDFNSWFLNWYRPRGLDGSDGDYIGFHSDEERHLATASDGRSVVFGLTLTDHSRCVRVLEFRPKKPGKTPVRLPTKAGQAYVMEGNLQKFWTHGIPRSVSIPGSRISLTARRFLAEKTKTT